LPTDLVRELTEGLSDPNPEVRGEFATALTNTEIDQVEIIPALAKALNDDQVGV
jgi:HEAT repeat protein